MFIVRRGKRACVQQQGSEPTLCVVAHQLLYITDILTIAASSTLVFFHYCCYPRGPAEHLRPYLKVSCGSVSAECNLSKSFVHVTVSFEAFLLRRVFLSFLFTCTKLL